MGNSSRSAELSGLPRDGEAGAPFPIASAELQIVLDAIDHGVSILDAELKIKALNRKFREIMEFPEELCRPGTPLAELIRHNLARGERGPDDVEGLVLNRADLPVKELPKCIERLLPNGRMIEIRNTPLPDGGFVSTYTDVTAKRRSEDALQDREKELRQQIDRFNVALSNMSQGLCMFGPDKRLVVCNTRYLEMYNISPELAAPGTHFRQILEDRVDSGVYADMDPEAYIEERLAAVEEPVRSTKLQELTDGRTLAIVHQPMANGGWVATHEDVTELQTIQARMTHMAHHDPLTDLPNRAMLRQRLETLVAVVKRGKKHAIFCLDLDRFKTVNDTLGHPVGDKLLVAAAERLRGCVRQSDIIARLGGDEFAIVSALENHPTETVTLARRICEVLSEPFDIDGHHVVIGTSIGIAVAPEDGADPDKLLKCADMALYRAKTEGGGAYSFFEPGMDARMQERRQLELDLRTALERDEFELYYQPLVSLQSGRIRGMEALLRWRHPRRGLMGPVDFVPLAEEIGLLVPLGEWVIRQATAEAASWPDHVNVAVNLSPGQFRSEHLVATVFSALHHSGIVPGRLELEITENAILENEQATLDTLHALRDMGVRIVMDDFGTGYSSLSYLRNFPFSKIKIDRSFVQALSYDDNAAVIVNAVATLSRSLGMITTAEGVETEIQREQVKNAGYDEMQGFLYSPPRSREEIFALFSADLEPGPAPRSKVPSSAA